MKPKQTAHRLQGGVFAWILAACLVLACVVPAFAWADGSLFGNLKDKAASSASQQAADDEPELPEFKLNKTAFSCEADDVRPLKVAEGPLDEAVGDVTWESSDPAVATVDEFGYLTAHAKGTATITASIPMGAGIATASCEVTVVSDQVLTSQALLFESEHDYANDCRDVWTYVNGYVTGASITFDERTSFEEGFDFLRLYDENDNLIAEYTGTELAGQTVHVEGFAFSLRIDTDEENTDWGFAIVEFEPDYQEGWVDDVVDVYYIVNGEKATGLWQIDGVWHWFDEETGAWAPIPDDVDVPKDPIGVEDLEEGEGPQDPIGVETPDEELTFFMPNLVGMSLWEARDLCNVLVFGCDDQWAYSDTVPWGTVMAQDIPADTIVEQGGGVLVTVSAGPEYNAVPDLFGMTLEQAQAALYDIALGCDDVWVYDAYRPWGTVVAQDVEPGTLVRQGGGVVVTISAGPEPTNMITVPNYNGFDYENAQWNIWSLGLNCDLNFIRTDWAPAGIVIDQSPWPDKQIEEWGTITLTVSMGMDHDFMPDYYGYYYLDPWDSLNGWGYSVVIDDSAVPSDESMAGVVYDTYPLPNKLVQQGSTVTLYIYRHADGTPIIMG